MWSPRDDEEVERAAREGRLEETASFDAKRELPATPNKNVDLATDVAAMATDGGVLLYGVAEDEHQRPTIPQPIPLAGAADRVGQIVSTSIAEVPHIELRELPCADDPSRGYLVVIVPQSPRAPHQVIVGGDLRFYGRGSKGNRRLNEGEVARLYERRHGWAVDRDALLEEVVAHAPVSPSDELGYVHAIAFPVVRDHEMWGRAEAAHDGDRRQLQRSMSEAINRLAITKTYSPSLRSPHSGSGRERTPGVFRR